MSQSKRSIWLLTSTTLVAITIFPGSQKPYPVVTTVKNGVKTITNPDYPKEGRFVARLTEEMSCGEKATPEEATLGKPIDLKVDDQGQVYAMDWGDMHIKIYDEQGHFLRTVSRSGQGPGEFGLPSRFELMKNGNICILDGGQRRVSFLSNEGQYLSSFNLEGFFRSLAVDGQGRFYLAKWEAAGEPVLSGEFREVPYVTKIFRTDVSGKEFVHLLDMFGETLAMKSVAGGGVVSFGGLHEIVWNVNRRGRLYGGYNETYLLNAYSEDGKVAFAFGRECTLIKNTRYKGQVGQKRMLPAFSRSLIFDDDDNLWIEATTKENTKGYIYDIFSPEGIYLRQVKSEEKVTCIKNGKIYSLLRSEDQYPYIKRFGYSLEQE